MYTSACEFRIQDCHTQKRVLKHVVGISDAMLLRLGKKLLGNIPLHSCIIDRWIIL